MSALTTHAPCDERLLTRGTPVQRARRLGVSDTEFAMRGAGGRLAAAAYLLVQPD